MERSASRGSAVGARPPSRDRPLTTDPSAVHGSRPQTSARASAVVSRPSTRGSASTRPQTRESSDSLSSKLEEYKRLSHQLGARTDNLISQTEEVLRHKEEILSSFERAHEQAAAHFEPSDDEVEENHNESEHTRTHAHTDTQRDTDEMYDEPRVLSAARARSHSRNTEHTYAHGSGAGLPPRTASSRPPTTKSTTRPHSRQAPPVDGSEDAVMAAVLAGEISDEAAVRLLKAKLRVMLEERAATFGELKTRDEAISDLESRLKTATTEGARHDSVVRTLQQQIDKTRKALDDATAALEAERTTCASLRKEFDGLRKAQRADSASHGSAEIRLNRALEENQRLKEQLQQAQAQHREADEQLRDRVTRAEAEARTLSKHKADLLTAFQKQSQLVDVLRRQRIHIEAAKALGFCEEEFMKALDWSG